jgi:hypothetical protein
MSLPNSRAVGSYGPDLEQFAENRTGKPLDWWQKLAARRILEHDANGELVWQEWLLSVARQNGKSWLLRELALWRVCRADLIGEEQLVMHMANTLKAADEVQRSARMWVAVQPSWKRWEGSNQKGVMSPNGSRWLIFAAGSPYSFSSGFAIADEAWAIPATLIEDGVEPTMVERKWPQLGIVSTANPEATSLVIDRRLAAMVPNSPALLLEWSAHPWLDLGSVEGWRMASPRWSNARYAMVAKIHQRAIAGTSRTLGETDPVASFRAQWLNQWIERTSLDGVSEGEPLVPPGGWSELAGTADFIGPVTFAIEDYAGLAVSMAAAGVIDEAGAVIGLESYAHADRRVAYRWVAEHAASRPGSVLVVGAALRDDAAVADMPLPVRVASSADIKADLAVLRQVVARQGVKHAPSAVLDGQLDRCRVVSGNAGMRVVSRERWDAVRVASWAIAECERQRRSQPTVY